MKIIISANNFEVTQNLENYINKKFSKLEKLADGFNKNSVLKIVISRETKSKEGNVLFIKANLDLLSFIISNDEIGEDIYAMVDKIQEELNRQLKKKKDKFTNKFIKGARKFKELFNRHPDI
jgi:ribosomal subunit interface protein